MRSLWNTCGKLVESAWKACGQSVVVFHSFVSSKIRTWKTSTFFQVMYTFCVQNCTAIVGKITSVKSLFYTEYTGLTKTTTN